MIAALNNVHFPLQGHSKLSFNRFYDFSAQLVDLLPQGLAVVYEYQCLFGIAAYISMPIAFPATLLNEPACRQFGMGRVHRESDDVWKFLFQFFKLGIGYLRIFKKGTGTGELSTL